MYPKNSLSHEPAVLSSNKLYPIFHFEVPFTIPANMRFTPSIPYKFTKTSPIGPGPLLGLAELNQSHAGVLHTNTTSPGDKRPLSIAIDVSAVTRATGIVTFVPRSWRLLGASLGALIGFPGSFGAPRNAGFCEGTPVGLPKSGRFTPESALVGVVPDSTSTRVDIVFGLLELTPGYRFSGTSTRRAIPHRRRLNAGNANQRRFTPPDVHKTKRSQCNPTRRSTPAPASGS